MQWNQKPLAYLQQAVASVQTQEQTQELRLPEGMPDAENVICTWGQGIVRSKQWRSDSLILSCGVSGSLLYSPQGGGKPQIVTCWIPFQAKWTLPEGKPDGIIHTHIRLRSMDARLISSRKLMVRASVSILAEAYVPQEAAVYTVEEKDANLELLEMTYPLEIPTEAGEKLFLLEEDVALPEQAQQLLAWDMEPVISEQTVIGGRAVFKGTAYLHIAYMGPDERIHSHFEELPFAQYADLDKDYDKEATVEAFVTLSGLETELTEDKVNVKASLIIQYLVCDRTLVKLVEDAYSPLCPVEVTRQELQLPVKLDARRQNMEVRQTVEGTISRVADKVCYMDEPVKYREGELTVVEVPGILQILGYDPEGALQCCTEHFLQRWELPASENCYVSPMVSLSGPVMTDMTGSGMTVGQDLTLQMLCTAQQSMPMITELSMGDPVKQERPSLILKRSDDKGLWELAKGCGSTMDAIRRANHLEEDPEPGQMLLIPLS